MTDPPSTRRQRRASRASSDAPASVPPRIGRRYLAFALSLCLALVPVESAPPPLPPSLQLPAAHALSDEQRLIADAWRIVHRAYVDRTFNGNDWFGVRQRYLRRPCASRADTYAAIGAMLAELGDPYTRLLTPPQYRSLTAAAQGELVGVGVEFFPTRVHDDERAAAIDDGGGVGTLRVLATVDASPAARAGVRAMDELLQIDGDDVSALSPDEAAARIRGRDGSEVVLTVRHAGRPPAEQERIALRRAHVRLQSVSHRMLDSDTGYVRIKQFSSSTADELRDAIADLQRANGASHSSPPPLQRLIVDLRDNPGGYFPGGIDAARLFLPDDTVIVYVARRDGIQDEILTNAAGPLADAERTRLVLLINNATASASEILAGSLQDNYRGVLVGERSFGKGVVQTVRELRDGSALAVTVARYETPRHRDINKRGIEPDVQAAACTATTPAQVLECVPAGAWR